MRYRLVIFDFDGTLIDSAACIVASIERALAALGRRCDSSRVREQIGLPLDEIIRAASPGIEDDVLADAVAGYRRAYATLEPELIAPFPGAVETVEALHAGGVTLAIATNKLTTRAQAPLVRLGIADRFDAIVGSDQVAHPKPHPEIVRRILSATRCPASAAVMVGDTEWDIEIAARAGIASCAVTWGNHGAARLARAQPTHTVGSFTALRNLVETLEGAAERN
jgi:2-phosphoglycolate phosphatase